MFGRDSRLSFFFCDFYLAENRKNFIVLLEFSLKSFCEFQIV